MILDFNQMGTSTTRQALCYPTLVAANWTPDAINRCQATRVRNDANDAFSTRPLTLNPPPCLIPFCLLLEVLQSCRRSVSSHDSFFFLQAPRQLSQCRLYKTRRKPRRFPFLDLQHDAQARVGYQSTVYLRISIKILYETQTTKYHCLARGTYAV